MFINRFSLGRTGFFVPFNLLERYSVSLYLFISLYSEYLMVLFSYIKKFFRATWDVLGYVIIFLVLLLGLLLILISITNYLDLVLIANVALTLFSLAVILLIQYFYGSLKETMSSPRLTLKDTAYSLGVGTAEVLASSSLIVLLFAAGLYPEPTPEFLHIAAIPIVGLTAIIVAPVVEEILFRGILLRRLLKYMPPFSAVLIQAALFSLFHMELFQLPYTFTFGVIVGYIFVWTRSLWLVMLVHFAANAFTVLASWLVPEEVLFHAEPWHPLTEGSLILIVSLIALFILFLRFYRQRDRNLPCNQPGPSGIPSSITRPAVLFVIIAAIPVILAGRDIIKKSPGATFSEKISSYASEAKINFYNVEARLTLPGIKNPAAFKSFANAVKDYLPVRAEEDLNTQLFHWWLLKDPGEALSFIEKMYHELPPDIYWDWMSSTNAAFLDLGYTDPGKFESICRSHSECLEKLFLLEPNLVLEMTGVGWSWHDPINGWEWLQSLPESERLYGLHGFLRGIIRDTPALLPSYLEKLDLQSLENKTLYLKKQNWKKGILEEHDFGTFFQSLLFNWDTRDNQGKEKWMQTLPKDFQRRLEKELNEHDTEENMS